MNAQEIFDTVSKHLLTQGVAATVEGSAICKYRTPDGNRCAIGCLIPEELYDPEMEGLALQNNNGVIEALSSRGINVREHQGMLRDLQVLHDTLEPGEWREALTEIAIRKDLSTEAL